MITASELYHVASAMVPLYAAMALGYASVRCWDTFSPDQVAGINRFSALYAVPLLAFRMIGNNDPYAMDIRFLLADLIQKVLTFLLLGALAMFREKSFAWVITMFSLSTLPNTVVLGVPLLQGMYGLEPSHRLMVQIVVMQFIVWFNCLLFMYEFNAASNALGGGDGIGVSNGAAVTMTRCARTRAVLAVVMRKLTRNPNLYAGILGLIWSLLAFRWKFKMPAILDSSIEMISVTAIGMVMFGLGMFMAREPTFISCGKAMAALSAAMKFLVSPVTMAFCSFIVGLHGELLRIAIVQVALPLSALCFVYAKEYNVDPDIMSTTAALPLSALCFVYAKEYNVDPDIMSTTVILGMLITVPAALLCYVISEHLY